MICRLILFCMMVFSGIFAHDSFNPELLKKYVPENFIASIKERCSSLSCDQLKELGATVYFSYHVINYSTQLQNHTARLIGISYLLSNRQATAQDLETFKKLGSTIPSFFAVAQQMNPFHQQLSSSIAKDVHLKECLEVISTGIRKTFEGYFSQEGRELVSTNVHALYRNIDQLAQLVKRTDILRTLFQEASHDSLVTLFESAVCFAETDKHLALKHYLSLEEFTSLHHAISLAASNLFFTTYQICSEELTSRGIDLASHLREQYTIFVDQII